MNAYTKLDATAAETLCRFLADRFDTTIPSVEFTNRESNHGVYWPFANLIRVSRNVCLWVVAHEYAHHLDHAVNPDFNRSRRRQHLEIILHGEAFFYNLLRVIEAIGITYYPWKDEYSQLQRWAKSRSLLIN